MDRIVRYGFCAAGIALTASWFGAIVTGYSRSSHDAPIERTFSMPAGEGTPVSELTESARMMRTTQRPPFGLSQVVKFRQNRLWVRGRPTRTLRRLLLSVF
jgi:hypothetical protein